MKAKLNCSGNSVIKALLPHENSLVKVDFYRAKTSTFGIHLLIRRGSAEHNMWLACYAISKGMRLKYSEGLIKDDSAIAGENEKGVFEALGLPYPLPSQREIVDNKPVWMPLPHKRKRKPQTLPQKRAPIQNELVRRHAPCSIEKTKRENRRRSA